MASVSSELRLGDRTLGDYELVGRLGAGDLLLGRHRRTGIHAAVRLLRPAPESEFRRQLLVQARAIAAVDHRNVQRYYAVGELDDGRSYIITEYMRGRTLREVLRTRPSLGAIPLLSIAVLVGRGIAALHAAGICNISVEPRTVMVVGALGNRHTVKLVDFSLARAVSSSRATTQVDIAPEDRMTPEELRAYPPDHRTDIYRFGLLVYELAMGALPDAPQPPGRTVDPAIAPIIGVCLRDDPEERYQTMHDVVVALDQARRNL
jgi:eukaryotic-like serine/threonine-protein kinase